MMHTIKLAFDDTDYAALDEIGRRLREQGWADHVTVPRALQSWQRLSVAVDRYKLTVEEYLNDLTWRDALELALKGCDEFLRTKLTIVVAAADKEFLQRTQPDIGKILEYYYRIDSSAEWWWRRRPVAGPLAEYLDRTPAS